LTVVGIGGKDVADGTPKLVLALVWQLMRLHALQLLGQLGVDDAGVLEWANAKVATLQPSLVIRSFSDEGLQSGIYMLKLLQVRCGKRCPAQPCASAKCRNGAAVGCCPSRAPITLPRLISTAGRIAGVRC
jgi:hypothetical protein